MQKPLESSLVLIVTFGHMETSVIRRVRVCVCSPGSLRLGSLKAEGTIKQNKF
jgi:hypothetical protein